MRKTLNRLDGLTASYKQFVLTEKKLTKAEFRFLLEQGWWLYALPGGISFEYASQVLNEIDAQAKSAGISDK